MELKEEKEKVGGVCMRRHRRWSLSLQLDRLHKDTEKVFIHSPDSTPVALPTVVVTCMTIWSTRLTLYGLHNIIGNQKW